MVLRRSLTVGTLCGLLSSLACTAEIGGPGSPSATGGAASTTPGGAAGSATTTGGAPATTCDKAVGLAPPRLWRLNDRQYANVVHDVFGASIAVPTDVSAATVAGAEDATGATSLKIDDVTTTQNYRRSAQATAASAVADLGTLLPCATPDATCVETFIRSKVARAFRRPLTDEQVKDMLAIYQLGALDTPASGVSALLEYVLQAPAFLWRTELAGIDPTVTPAAPQPLGAFELAAALSFLFIDSTPDDALWAKATDGTLTQPAILAAEVDRLLALPAVKANIASKVGSWLSVRKTQVTVKDPKVFPEFTPTVMNGLTQSVQLFLRDVVESGSLLDLVTSRKLYLNQELAALYGITGVSGSALVPFTATDPQWAGGILTQPALLAANARADKGDPIHRGLFIYGSMVCGATLPPPPANAVALDGSLPADATERARAHFRESRPDCTSCHGRFDPLGLLTERYDPLGRYTPTDKSGQPIDQTSTIQLGNNLDGPADGLPDLITRLKSSRQFADCASGKLAAISLGRPLDADNSCALRQVQDSFAADESFIGLFKSIATSPAFAVRDAKLQ
jgi:Protein of unknown function (DUF1592)/Protein of unknown function (DUF1588)/Protein of unknown function (DUF1595)/Protein of unknown function (DUF1585)